MFRLTPTFLQDQSGQPAHLTDDTIMVERGLAGSSITSHLKQSFAAPNVEAALGMVIEDLKSYLEQVTGERAQ
jgi:hypothetical protein